MGFNNKQTPHEYPSYEPQVYRTGSTAPQKSRRGLITLLLVAVIILGGAVSILGIMNIQLFRQLAKGTSETLPFMLSSTVSESAATPAETGAKEIVSSLLPEDSTLAASDPMNSTLSPDGFHRGSHADQLTHGICGESVSVFYQNYYHLPQGLYITEVIPGSCAEAAGLQPGDILLSLNGNQITTVLSLEAFFAVCAPETQLMLTVYRNGQEISLPLILAETDH